MSVPQTSNRNPPDALKELLRVSAENQRLAESETTVGSGETLTVEEDETEESGTFNVAGTVDNGGTMYAVQEDIKPWTLEPPKIKLLQETRQAERGPGQGQPAEMYIWQDGMNYDLHSADGDHLDGTGDVDIWIVTLEDGLVGEDNQQYMNDCIDFVGEYINDNSTNTPFLNVQPSSADDQRAEHITGTTDHHASVVTVQIRDFRATGL